MILREWFAKIRTQYKDTKIIVIVLVVFNSLLIFLFINWLIGILGFCLAYGLARVINVKSENDENHADVVDPNFKELKPRPTINEIITKYIVKRSNSEYQLKTWIDNPAEVSRLTCRLGLLDCIISDLESLLSRTDNTITKTTMEHIHRADELMESRKMVVSFQ